MEATTRFESVSPIGDTDPLALPVADVERAIAYYTDVLGFTLSEQQNNAPKSALLFRDAVTLGFAENGGDPEQASCYIQVSGVAALHEEYQGKGVDVTPKVGEMEHGGKRYEVFWAKDPDGICYCIGRPIG
jgi:lactoylglutathione lyase